MNKPVTQEAQAAPPDAASRRSLWVVVAVGGLLVFIVAGMLIGRPAGSSPPATNGTTASGTPPGDLQVSVPTIEGGQYDFSAQAGKPMLLFLSASWCLPCLGEVPKLAKLHTTYENQGLQVVALDLDTNEDAGAWKAFKLRAGGADHVWAMDPANKVTLALGVSSTDTKVIFDRTGREIFRTVGPTEYDVLDQHVREALR